MNELQKDLKVIKRDGRSEKFDISKIIDSIDLAVVSLNMPTLDDEKKQRIVFYILENIDSDLKEIQVEDIQDRIEKSLYMNGLRKVRDAFKSFRKERTDNREFKSDIMNVIKKIGVQTDRDNANVGNNFSAKLLRIASEANKWQNAAIIPKELIKLHESLDYYIHDLDSYNLTTNCLHIPTGKVLRDGFNTGYGTINPAKRIGTAAELSCILMQSTQNDMFGGQSHPNFDNDLAPFLKMTYEEIAEEVTQLFGEDLPRDKKVEYIAYRADKELQQAMQGVVYNLNTMHCRAGSQVPFSSINLGIPHSKEAALICEAFLCQYEKGLGKHEQPIFPNIIFRVKKGVNRDPGDPYYYLFKVACRVAAKRMNPTFMNMDADFNKEHYDKGLLPSTMGCRTYLMSNINGEAGVEGRGNNAPVTINLPRLGIKTSLIMKNEYPELEVDSNEYKQISEKKFFEMFDNMIDNSKKQLLHRHETMKQLKVKDLPFVAGQGLMKGSEGLGPDDSIEPILLQGTYGIGFTGLAETLIAIRGKHHAEDSYSRDLGERIVTHLREKTDKITKETHLNWSCYATPAEGLSGKFVPTDRKIYGIIPGVTDKDYYTNSYHVPVGHKISIKEKVEIEAPYHKLCNAGHISYIELDNYPTGETIENIVKYSYENTNISYIGINFHIRYCRECGTYLHGENECPTCESKNIQGVSRITGYLSLDERFGPGKSAERKDRTNHNSNHMNNYKLK